LRQWGRCQWFATFAKFKSYRPTSEDNINRLPIGAKDAAFVDGATGYPLTQTFQREDYLPHLPPEHRLITAKALKHATHN
jgi:hypothetical protein